MSSINDVKRILVEVLQIADRTDQLDGSTQLLGGIPEFDSMAVVSVITAIEDRYDIEIDDDEIDADIFETLASLHEFVSSKTQH